MEIHYSQHFLHRLALRGIPQSLSEDVFYNADQYFYDSSTNTYVAVKRLHFSDANRDIALTYSQDEERIIFITIHPLQEGQMERRILSNRWEPNEP